VGPTLASPLSYYGPLTCSFIDVIQAATGKGGRVLVSGMGKSGVVARRMAVSLSSTGTAGE